MSLDCMPLISLLPSMAKSDAIERILSSEKVPLFAINAVWKASYFLGARYQAARDARDAKIDSSPKIGSSL